MNSPTICFQPSEVDALLDGDFTPEEVARAEEHLAVCEGCRSAIELAIGPRHWWSDVQRSLGTQGDDVYSTDAFGQAVSAEERTPTNKLLELLGPTDDPAMLGRIGSYEITALLGQGGMGAVFKGFDRSLNRFVAIKVLLPHLAASGAARQRFAREGQAVAAVVDNHVMPIHCVDEWRGVPYLVMPYARGVSLQKRLNDEGPLELREVLRIGMQAARGLAAAHAQGIVHRDVKPANILLDEKVERAQLMDFGLARAVDDASLTRSGMLAGTPQYMSPEQARAEKVGQRSDLFSLGAVLYAMCTGRAPFRAESSYSVLRLITDSEPRPVREINPDIPEWLCHIVGKLMAKRAEDRFQSADEVSKLLEACLAHVQQPTDVSLPQSLIPTLKRKPRFAIPRRSTGFITVVAALGAIVLAAVLSISPEPPDIAGRWKSDDWGDVEFVRKQPSTYEGTFTVTLKDDRSPRNVDWRYAGEMHLKWSRFERRYNGTWKVGDLTAGRISLRLVDGEIRGALTTKRGQQGQLGTPRLGDFRWTRALRFTAPLEVPNETGQVISGEDQKVPGTVDPPTGHAPGSTTRRADTGTSLLDAIREFNQKYQNHEVGKKQPPLTDDEVIASIRWAVMSDGQSEVPDPYRQQLLQIAELRQLPPEWAFKVVTEVEGVDGERFQAWSIRLVFSGTPGVPPHDHSIRNRLLWQLDAAGQPIVLGQLDPADDAADSKPLAAAIRGFNVSHRRLAGLNMPPLTEQEVIAAIRFQKTRRNYFDITDGEFARLQQIADTRRLPADAEISVLTGYQPGDGYRYDIWSIRFSMRKQVNTIPYPFTGFTIREHYVQSQPLDLDKIAWGPVAENGLQAGVRFEPRLARCFVGQEVTPYFYYRNTGDRKFDISFPNLESGKPVAVDNAGVAIPVDKDENEKWLVGFMSFGEFGFGSQHEVRGRTIVLGDVERGDAEFAIRAKAAQAVRVHFVLSNYGDQRGSRLQTGEIAFTMAAAESKQSGTER